MKNPLISCVVPTFNSARYLGEALDSILAQTYRPIEVIVTDDGSTDGTVDVVDAYSEHIRFVSQPTSGPSATRNLGLCAAKGGFVAFLDADDLWHPEKLERQMRRFEERRDLDVSVTHVRMFWADPLSEERAHYQDHSRAQNIPGYATTTLLAPRRVFDTVGPFNTEYWFGDATDWFLRAREEGLVMELMPDVLTYHRMHESNLTRRRSRESRDEFLTIVKESLDRRRKKALP